MDLLPDLSMEGSSKNYVSVLVRKAVRTQVLILGPLSPSIGELSADLLSCTPSVQLKGASLNAQIHLCSRCRAAGRGHLTRMIPSHFSHEDQQTLCFLNYCLPSWCP